MVRPDLVPTFVLHGAPPVPLWGTRRTGLTRLDLCAILEAGLEESAVAAPACGCDLLVLLNLDAPTRAVCARS